MSTKFHLHKLFYVESPDPSLMKCLVNWLCGTTLCPSVSSIYVTRYEKIDHLQKLLNSRYRLTKSGYREIVFGERAKRARHSQVCSIENLGYIYYIYIVRANFVLITRKEGGA